MEIELTGDQPLAESMLKVFLKSSAVFATIIGSAGVGKTFMMQILPSLFPAERTLCTAPTNKAVKVLRKVIPAEIECVTIHKFLGLSVKNVKDKKVSYRSGTYDPTEWAHVKLVLVDEGSMLDDNLTGFMEEDAREWGRQYIVMGDDCQLPPIEGDRKKTRSFDIASPRDRVIMAQIVRQAADNPIIRTATLIRDAIKAKKEPKLVGGINEEQGTGVWLLKRDAWVAKLEGMVGDPRIHTDVDYCRVIAWTNDTVRAHNLAVRKCLGADVTKPFDLGDTVVVNDAVESGHTIILGTGEEVIIKSMKQEQHPVFDFKGWEVTLEKYDMSAPLIVLDECDRAAYLKQLDKIREKCLNSGQWQPFYGLKNYYADLRPPYAITAHKSQGSTFENVFVDLKDMYSGRNQGLADKCLYVGITRASRRVYVLV